MPDDGVERLADSSRPHGPIVVFDRPTSPGNIGTLARSADAFGASALVVTGHAADPYDPQAVRASTGSLFALTVLRVPGPGPVVEYAHAHGYRIVGTDEVGSPLSDVDLGGRVVVVVGNETNGLSSGWRAVCDDVASISMVGTASSLNAAVAGLDRAARGPAPARLTDCAMRSPGDRRQRSRRARRSRRRRSRRRR